MSAAREIGLPSILKTRRFGYDGKGQYLLRDESDLTKAWQALEGQPAILEGFIQYDREVSLLSVRDKNGNMIFYPIAENYHEQGILRRTIVPVEASSIEAQAIDANTKLMTSLDYVGVLAVEYFQQGDTLTANEMAPRVHNSGHWSIEGAATSQFENHIRALGDLPVGQTDAIGFSAMVNCIGQEPTLSDALSIPHTHYHTYCKEPRPNRKVGHVTIHCGEQATLNESLQRLVTLVPK